MEHHISAEEGKQESSYPPLDKTQAALHILVLDDEYWTFQYPPSTPLPPSIWTNTEYSFITASKASDELSITVGYPPSPTPEGSGAAKQGSNAKSRGEGVEGMPVPDESHGPWKALRVKGPMDLSLEGILTELTRPLKYAHVPIFAISTWNTDYVLIDAANVTKAITALRKDGWTVLDTTAP